MIIGEFKREIGSEKLKNVSCMHCGESQINVKVFSHFFTLGLPFFPTRKSTQIECSHCKSANPVDFKNISNQTKITEIVSHYKHPKFAYLMLGFIAFAMIVGLFKECNKKSEEKIYSGVRNSSVNPSEIIEEDSISYTFNGKNYTFPIENSPETALDSLKEASYSQTTHEAALYLIDLLNKANKTQSNDPIEIEADDYKNNVIIVGSIPNLEWGTKAAKIELLNRATKEIKRKFGYENVYLGFADDYLNLLAIQVEEKQYISDTDMEFEEGEKLQNFYLKKMLGL